MVVKKKDKEEVEVQDGWAGRVLPFELVQRALLPESLAQIEAKDARLAQVGQELVQILDDMDEEDKAATPAVNETGDGFVAAELKRAAKAAGKNPETALDRALVQAQGLIDESQKLKKDLKALRTKLDEDTKAVIEGLSDEQCRELLEAKWVDPLCRGLEKIPEGVVEDFTAKAKALCEKYATTYADVCDQISSAEAELASMLGDLTGSDSDLAGIAELQKLLGGE